MENLSWQFKNVLTLQNDYYFYITPLAKIVLVTGNMECTTAVHFQSFSVAFLVQILQNLRLTHILMLYIIIEMLS